MVVSVKWVVIDCGCPLCVEGDNRPEVVVEMPEKVTYREKSAAAIAGKKQGG